MCGKLNIKKMKIKTDNYVIFRLLPFSNEEKREKKIFFSLLISSLFNLDYQKGENN